MIIPDLLFSKNQLIPSKTAFLHPRFLKLIFIFLSGISSLLQNLSILLNSLKSSLLFFLGPSIVIHTSEKSLFFKYKKDLFNN